MFFFADPYRLIGTFHFRMYSEIMSRPKQTSLNGIYLFSTTYHYLAMVTPSYNAGRERSDDKQINDSPCFHVLNLSLERAADVCACKLESHSLY